MLNHGPTEEQSTSGMKNQISFRTDTGRGGTSWCSIKTQLHRGNTQCSTVLGRQGARNRFTDNE